MEGNNQNDERPTKVERTFSCRTQVRLVFRTYKAG